MRRALCLGIVLCLVLLAGAASGEVFLNKEKPADWYERDLLVITMFDYYQNDAFVLQCGGETMLIDGGVKAHREKLQAWLEEHGLTHLDIMFNTHPHDDHLECQISLLRNKAVTVGRFISPFPREYRNEYQQTMVKVLDEQGIPYVQMLPDEKLTLGGAWMVMYRWPDGKAPNPLSGVLWVHFGDATILLTGDLTGEGERWMAQHYGPEGLKSDILKAPHHGIMRMVSEFLKTVDPSLTIVTNDAKTSAKAQMDTGKTKYANICICIDENFNIK